MSDAKSSIEAFDPKSSIETIRQGLIQAQKRTWDLVEELSDLIVPGMSEAEAIRLCDELYERHGILKKWHKNRIRFGSNTLLSFRDPSDSSLCLRDQDIYFIDIGPVVDGFEGDCGATFVQGSDSEMHSCARAAKELFYQTQHQWRENGLSGEALYKWATEQARKMGWDLNLNLAGHRVSEFPHAIHYKGPLSGIEFTPKSGLWILEIQIRHPRKAFGAFFEDLLS